MCGCERTGAVSVTPWHFNRRLHSTATAYLAATNPIIGARSRMTSRTPYSGMYVFWIQKNDSA
jgi:hypothetical protein